MKQKQTLLAELFKQKMNTNTYQEITKNIRRENCLALFFSLLAISVTLFLVHRRDGLGILALLAYSLFYRP